MAQRTLAGRISNSAHQFIDTNVLLRRANDDSADFSGDIAAILAEAAGPIPKRLLWISSILFAELRPSSFKPGKFKDVDDLARYIRSIATVVDPDPYVMMRAARLRDQKWQRSPAKKTRGEKLRCLTLGDAVHLSSAVWVKEAQKVPDLEFVTLDNKARKSPEADPGTKTLPLLSLEQFTHGIGDDPDVFAVVGLIRVLPRLR